MHGQQAQMSFSMAAVLILLVSSFAAVIINDARTGTESNGSSSSMRHMEDLSNQALVDLEETAYSCAVSLLMENGTDKIHIQLSFYGALEKILSRTYPQEIGGYVISVDCSDVRLDLLSLPVGDLIGNSRTGMDNTAAASIPAYFSLVGKISVNISRSIQYLVRTVDIDREVYLPIPLIVDRLDMFQQLNEGGSSLLWRTVHYELSALAQFRLLGFGSVGPLACKGLLTEEDIKNAFILASILVQIECFRSYDPNLLDCLHAIGPKPLDTNGLRNSLEDPIGDIDPADLILKLYQLDQIDPSMILAQSLYASADMLALRWLDYLHITDALSTLESIYETGQISAEQILGKLMGRDLTGEKAEDWLVELMSSAGIDELEYRYLCESDPDYEVMVDEPSICLRNESGGWASVSISDSFPIDLGPTDIFDNLDWSDFYKDYRQSSSQLLQRLSLFVKSMAISISKGAISPIDLDLDPCDGVGFMEEIDIHLRKLLEGGAWYQSRAGVDTQFLVTDPMGEAFIEYLQSRSEQIFLTNETIERASSELSSIVYDRIEASNLEIGGSFRDENIEIIKGALGPGSSSAVHEEISSLYRADVASMLDQYRIWMNSTDGLGKRTMESTLTYLSKGLIESVPGIEDWVRDRVLDTLTEMDMTWQMTSERLTLPLGGTGPFELLTGKGLNIKEHLKVTSSLDACSTLDQGLQIYLEDPSETDEKASNLHLTNVLDCSSAPFQNIWNVTARGSFDITLEASCPGAEKTFGMTRQYHVYTSRELTGVTGWPLSQVDYTTSNTLDQDALMLLQRIYDTMASALCDIGEGAVQTLDYVTGLVSQLARYCSEGIDTLAHTLCDMVFKLQDWMRSGMNTMGRLVETVFPENHELSLSFNMWGVDCLIQVHGCETSLHDSTELISFTTNLNYGDSFLSMTSRLVRLQGGDYCMLINGTIRSPTTIVSVVIDPVMTIFDHFIEITGIVNGRCVEIVLPEYNFNQEVSFSLSQVPGLGRVLSNIPLPIPGVKAQIDAGFYFKFSTPNADHPVINEYEQNPSGRDAGNEWVEIYNPKDTAVSMSGWSLRTAHGIVHLDDLGSTIILPRGYAVYRYNGQALDNGDRARFPFAESVALIDPNGRKVDSSPYTFDEENDGRSWQRSYDAGDGWNFRPATKGLPNSPLHPGPIDQEGITSIIITTMTEALEQLEAFGYDLDSLGKVMVTAINNLAVRLLDLLFERVAEVGLFIKVAFCDETGALSTGFQTSLLVDGNFLPEAFAWFGEVARELLNDPLSPISSKTTMSGLEILTDNVWVGFNVQTQAGLPELFASSFQGMEFKMAFQVKANIAQLGELLDRDLGRSKICAGLLVSGSSNNVITDIPFARDRLINECWLIKVTITER